MRALSNAERELIRAEGDLLQAAMDVADHLQYELKKGITEPDMLSRPDQELISHVKKYRAAKKVLKRRK